MHKKKRCVFAVCCLAIFLLNNCINEQKKISDYRGGDYAGSVKCQGCHQEIFNSYVQTAHNKTSSIALKKTIKGSFAKDSNIVKYRSEVRVKMEQRDSGLYQVAYLDDVEKQAARFDIVMGSGRKGQSYLSWHDNTVFQLPISYFVPGKTWINSPGYPPKYVLFNRNIPVGCFECHSSYINRKGSQPIGGYLVDHFDKKQIIYGIDCERCHGPLAAHVKYQEENPDVRKPKFVMNIATLQRQQKLDMCAVCHSGADETTSASFNYAPGNKLSDYIHLDNAVLRTGDIDVHGKQYQLLSASQCFIKSKTITCLTCHDPHKDARNQLEEFSKKCMSCHTNPAHASFNSKKTLQNQITANCIDCHMPAKPSRVITMKSADKNDSVSAFVRTHFISVYKEASLQYLKKK